jgi:hypothetical protein
MTHSLANRGSRSWRLFVGYLPPMLLTAVALQQIVLSRRFDMSPWKGGGFGMFASVDAPTQRFMRSYLVVDGRDIPVTLPDRDLLGDSVTRAITLPTAGRLEGLAATLARRSWYLERDSGIASPESGSAGTSTRLRPSAIRLEVFRIVFIPETLEVERVLLGEVTRKLR